MVLDRGHNNNSFLPQGAYSLRSDKGNQQRKGVRDQEARGKRVRRIYVIESQVRDYPIKSVQCAKRFLENVCLDMNDIIRFFLLSLVGI